MNKLSILILVSILCGSALATVDVQSQATIVVENFDSGEYFLQTVPAEYCVGIDSLTLATAITQPVTIRSNYGCGSDMISESQVNAATCATVTAEEVTNPDGSYNFKNVSIKIDVSKCGDKKNNKKFTDALEKAVYNTYNASGYQVVNLK